MTELVGLTITGIFLIPAVVALLMLGSDAWREDRTAGRWIVAGIVLIVLRTGVLPFFEALPLLGLYLDLALGWFDPNAPPPPPPADDEWPPGPYMMLGGIGLGWLILQLGSLARAVGWLLLARGLWLLARPVERDGMTEGAPVDTRSEPAD